MPLIIGLTGQAGSGKGTVGTYLRDHYGAEFLTFSSYLRKTLEMLALESSRDNMIKLSEALRHAFGEDAISHAIAQDALKSTAPVVVVDGIRRPQDITVLQTLPHFHLVAIDGGDARTRYERLTTRGEKTDDATSFDYFLELEQRPTEQTIPAVMAQASIRLRNDGTMEDIQKQVDEMMQQLEH